MKIRLANFDTDALAIVNGAREFANSTSLRSWFRSGDDFVSDISKVMTLENVEILVAESESKVVGGISIAYIPFIWNQSILVGDELFWWVSKEAPTMTGGLLFKQAMKNIEEQGAIPMFRSLDTSPSFVPPFYRRQGLHQFESVFTRVA